MANAKENLLHLLGEALGDGSFVKLTLGAYRGRDRAVKQVQVRPVELREGPRLSFVWRYETRDVTKNFPHDEALSLIEDVVGADFCSANLFTTRLTAQLEFRAGRQPRLIEGKPAHSAPASTAHDKPKQQRIDPQQSPWLQGLGVTAVDGKVAKGMEAKFRQINKFVEVLEHLLADARLTQSPQFRSSRREEAYAETSGDQRLLTSAATEALALVDMGCGKGYLTFAAFDWLRRNDWKNVVMRGIETRPELVELCNRVSRDSGCDGLNFEAGTIDGATLERVDVLVALHACDTATDDAIAKGVQAGAALIIVSPCCHKELRPQITPPPALAGALRHGILLERQAEFVTDALRAALLEWAGYDTKVFEFIATEHTAKNLMIAAVKRSSPVDRDVSAVKVRELAAFYGVRSQRLATNLNFPLVPATASATT